jgi:NADH-ubiquinone oxidoreductase chain 2
MLTTLLFSNAFTLIKNLSISFSRVTILVLLHINILELNNFYITPMQTGIVLYGGLFNTTTTTHAFNIFIFSICLIILTLTSFYPRKLIQDNMYNIYNMFSNKLYYNKNIILNKEIEQFNIIEYPLIIIFVLSGGIFLMSTVDIICIFLSIELQSYGLYIICTLYRNSELATGSGLTYFLLGGLSSCFILIGSAFLYANSGTTSLDNIYIINNINQISNIDIINTSTLYIDYYNSKYIYYSFILIVIGFLFKVSAAPFHFWSPDVYDGIPTVTTAFVANVGKISIFIFLMEIVYYTHYNLFTFSLRDILLLSSFLSLMIGSIQGLTQFRIKRLFAYSTISHVGFILLSLSTNSMESLQSYVFYIFQYTISNLNLFFILISIGYTLSSYYYKKNIYNDKLVDVNNSPIQLIDQIKGYFYVNSYITISLCITLFSLVGIPPILGFFAKQMVLSAALNDGLYFISFVAVLTSVIAAVYYLKLVNQVFFFNEKEIDYISIYNANDNRQNTLNTSYVETKLKNVFMIFVEKLYFNQEAIKINSALSVVISVITLLLITFIFLSSQLLMIANLLTLTIFNS